MPGCSQVRGEHVLTHHETIGGSLSCPFKLTLRMLPSLLHFGGEGSMMRRPNLGLPSALLQLYTACSTTRSRK
jgi:hypothetical protein